ncbi:MAG TPA: aldo/keto reductase [Chloroflexota bacterium]|nr:aldo/keto reductase [Chloroflexota bacterium]
MDFRRLGNSGLKVSAIGLGGNTFGGTVDGEEAVATIRRSLECGVTFIDTADIYSAGRSEELIGQAIAGRRHDVIVATKLRTSMGEGPYQSGLSRRWMMRAIEDSLRRLDTDYIDLYQAHSPDDDTPIEETLRAMDDLIHQGKVRYIGCSNYTAWQLAQALGVSTANGLAAWVSTQPRWNVLDGLSDPHLLRACKALGVGIIPYSPLASGVLTGKYKAGEEPPANTRATHYPRLKAGLTQERLDKVERLKQWAEERGRSVAELAVAWLLAHPEVSTVIIGARSPAQAEENVKANSWLLTEQERDEVAALVAES